MYVGNSMGRGYKMTDANFRKIINKIYRILNRVSSIINARQYMIVNVHEAIQKVDKSCFGFKGK